MTKRQCVFCGRPKLSKEHVIPSWVQAAVPNLGGQLPVRHSTQYAGGEDAWEADAFSLTVKRVCRQCNSGWMNDKVERPNQTILPPMFHGQPVTLDAAEQTNVATWAFKTHLMSQYRHRPFRPVAHDDLQCLYRQLKPTPKTLVWLGSYGGHGTHTAWARTYAMQLAPTPHLADVRTSDLVDAEAMTLCIGHLVLQTYKVSRGEGMKRAIHAEMQPFLVPIWPIVQPRIAWPPERTFGGIDSLSNFADWFIGPRAT